ncbi:sugar phosphate isomerase/epimerase family protein [Mucilaginibacter glaciei]|uniref:Sugar phosphate isomerase/epimerase n=1 Tax=Mucilaginibacter glaciei TaxID=2772109 RepID=A0A926NUZ0_9SPHI|nr:sugar phosphate isomerase/epimerase [Mucilaginibacter glaciei]MBD1395492.1 sugar phosphate isomerase/epimerase [Mucilaginibacter glaciei]
MNRRNFIYSSGLLTASAAMANAMAATAAAPTLPGGMGIQLYMVRNDVERDTPGTLKQLGKLGYKQLESYGSDKGIFWGMKNTEFKKLAADNGLKLVSTHHNPMGTAEFEQMAAQAAEIGMKYIICPWLGPQKSIETFKHFADDFNQRGAICKKHGLRYGYHPHDYPYKPVDGQLPINVLLANTDPALVYYQMDVYYTVTEGQDPYAYLKKYNGRFKLMHMRDVLKVRLPAGSKEESSCDLGEGIVNYPKLIRAGIAEGMHYFFVEGERYYKETPMQSAQKNAAYLKKMRLV